MNTTKTIIPNSQKQAVKTALQNPLPTMKKLVTGRLYYFMRYFWDTYSQDKFIGNWHIEKICEELEIIARRVAAGKPKLYDLVINVPPGTTKTATVSIFFPIWCWVNWYWMRFVTSSHSSSLSLESAEYSRDVIRSEKFQKMFPELGIRQDKDTKSNFRVIKKTKQYIGQVPKVTQGGGRVSTSVGAKFIGFHGHIIIPDDLVDPDSAISEAGIKQAISHLDQTLSQRKVDKEVSVMVMIMQRLSQNDPTGHLLKKQRKKIKHVCLPGEIHEYEEQLKPQEYKKYYRDGLLDPKRLSWKVLDDMKSDLGQYGYAGQVGQKPTPPGGGMFRVAHVGVRNEMPWDHLVDSRVRYWDKAGTQDGGAYTVGVRMSKLKDGTFVVEDVKRGQWGTNEREEIIKETAKADGKDCRIYVEQEPGSGGKESVQSTIRNLAGWSAYADRPTGDKVYRADPFSVQVNEGNVTMVQGRWNADYLDELENFPYSTYKDQVDASSGAFGMLTSRRKVIVRSR